MNEQIQTWLAATLEKLTTVAGQAADFASGELPLFVKEFLLFNSLWNWSMVVLGIVVITGSIFLAREGRKIKDSEGRIAVPLLCIILGGGFGTTVFLINLYWALMITLAPRVYLVHEFVRFFKPGN